MIFLSSTVSDIERGTAVTRIIAALAETMDATQLSEAAKKIRALDTDGDAERSLFADTAEILEEFGDTRRPRRPDASS